MNEIKTASLFRNGRNQAVRIPVEFELPGKEVTIIKDGNRLIIEPSTTTKDEPSSWAEFFDSLDPVDVDFPNVDEGLLPLDDIEL
ncbi:antitoxin [Devosia sp.]|uniref:antitoxin n=1 Tax=Devosia sp. TaxID=1871048 RepID=UPI00261E9252|nr:antitoxin [Devosia sp.]